MNNKKLSVIYWIADTVAMVLVIVGLCVTWLNPGDGTPTEGKKFKINHYGNIGLRHTCKSGAHSFNDGCLVYQGSVVAIVICTTALTTITALAIFSCYRYILDEDEDEDNNKKSMSIYVLMTSVTHLATFFQLLVAVVIYAIASHNIRNNLGYKFGPGWIIILVTTIISFCMSLMLFMAQCKYSFQASILSFFKQVSTSLTPLGLVLMIVGLCTSFYVGKDVRINALKVKGDSFGSESLKHFCGRGSDLEHLCDLYKSSATLIAFTVFGLLTSAFVLDCLGRRIRIITSITSFIMFLIGFVQYAVIGAKVKKSYHLNFGLGWISYLIGFILMIISQVSNIVSAIFCASKNREDDD